MLQKIKGKNKEEEIKLKHKIRRENKERNRE